MYIRYNGKNIYINTIKVAIDLLLRMQYVVVLLISSREAAILILESLFTLKIITIHQYQYHILQLKGILINFSPTKSMSSNYYTSLCSVHKMFAFPFKSLLYRTVCCCLSKLLTTFVITLKKNNKCLWWWNATGD